MSETEIHEAQDRLIATSLRKAAAERGGMDHANADAEMELADDMFNEAARAYAVAKGWVTE